ncbi:MAG TPA: arginase family protein [Egibacteraceae bacterium]|nr:arginase family protein [Egibacteraceae bacterium]
MDDPLWPRASAWLAGELGPPPGGAPLLAVLGAPLSQASISPSQAHRTPAAVRAALHRYSILAALPSDTVDLRAVEVADLGDLDLAELANDDAQLLVEAAVAELEDAPALRRPADLLVLLGGDNAITRPAMRAAMPLTSAGLLTLDAHHDVRDFHAGRSNGTPVRGLIDDGLPGGNVVQVGIGMFTNAPDYRRYCDEQGVTVVTAAQARRAEVGATVQEHLGLLGRRCAEIYVDLDVDVVDAAFVPGCPGARPGGIAPYELVEAAFAAGAHPGVTVIDLVEVDAAADPDGITVDLTAQCLLAAAAGLALRGNAVNTE